VARPDKNYFKSRGGKDLYDYDVICIGAGSGGCAAAMRSADLGKKVALVERREKDGTGGTCVNRGCIPLKALVKAAEVYNEVKSAKQYGICAENIQIDFKLVHQKKTMVVNNLRFGLDNLLLKPRKIGRLSGKARLTGPHQVEITKDDAIKTVTAANIVIATGSEPAMIPTFQIDGQKIITSDQALQLKEIPADITIIGAGAVGLEFAYIFSSFGSKVTVVEMLPHIAPTLTDEEITGMAGTYLAKNGVSVKTGVKILAVDAQKDGKVVCSFEGGETLETEKVLVAVGRTLNTGDLGLSQIGVATGAKGEILVDNQMRTSVNNIFAVGDITQGPQLSHKAQRQGLVAAEAIAGSDVKMDYEAIPWAIFMQPEIAGVGKTEADATAAGIETNVGRMPFHANEKALTMQKTTGMVKIVVRKDNGRVIGGQIFGADASVLIEEIALAIDNQLTVANIADSVHAHPTLAEIIMECSKNALGKSFHR
jgi:dihydrolipoamide dehydrogenase